MYDQTEAEEMAEFLEARSSALSSEGLKPIVARFRRAEAGMAAARGRIEARELGFYGRQRDGLLPQGSHAFFMRVAALDRPGMVMVSREPRPKRAHEAKDSVQRRWALKGAAR